MTSPLASVVAFTVKAMSTLAEDLASPSSFRRLLRDLGWEASADATTSALAALGDVRTDVESVYDSLSSALDDLQAGELTAAEIADLVQGAEDLVDLIQAFASVSRGSLTAPFDEAELWNSLAEELPGYLMVRLLESANRQGYQLLRLVGIVDETWVEAATGEGLRGSYRNRTLRLSDLGDLLGDPLAFLQAVYGWNGAARSGFSEAAEGSAEMLLDTLASLVTSLGGTPRRTDSVAAFQAHGLDPEPSEVAGMEALLVEGAWGSSTFLKVGFELHFYWRSADGLRAVLLQTVCDSEFTGEIRLGERLLLQAAGSWAVTGSSLLVQPSGVTWIPAGSETSGGLDLEVEGEEPILLFGRAGSTRLELERAGFGLGSSGDGGVELRTDLSGLNLVLQLTDGDGFLSTILGSRSLEAGFSVQVNWSQEGIQLSGAASLEVDIPVSRSIGPLAISLLSLGLTGSADGLQGTVAVTGGCSLGPLSVSWSRVGVTVELGPSSSGTLPATSLSFKPPEGLGISLDTGVVAGGGYLEFDPGNDQYSGAIELAFSKLALSAFGIVTTKMPGGESGWSFLVLISARFPPIPVAFGFFLEAVGGIFGYQRSVDVDVLSEGLSDGTLESVLFPDDPVADAPRIISDLEAAFPATTDQYVFGPMARLIWPSPSLIDFDLGIILEAPDPVRAVILGRISSLLPSEEAPLIKLNVDVLGVLDLDEGYFLFQAVLVDSSIVGLTLDGGMAMLLDWSGQPRFALSIGGFHPKYAPPPGFPELSRVSVSLDSDNPSIRMEGFLAITSNTVQFGASMALNLDLTACSIYGSSGFNALMVFSPFSFEVDVFFVLEVTAGKITLLGVDLEAAVAGPQPWEAHGKATFKIAGVKVKAQVSLTSPKSSSPPTVAAVDVEALLLQAMQDSANWTALPSVEDDPGITFGDEVEEGTVLAHPAGAVEFRQTIVPLGIDIDEYAGREVNGLTRFDLSLARLGEGDVAEVEVSAVSDWFAPGQYFTMSDSENLSSPDYESMEAGLAFGDDLLQIHDGPEVAFAYEEWVYGGETSVKLSDGRAVDFGLVKGLAASSAVARARATQPGGSPFANPAATPIEVKDTSWAAAPTLDLSDSGASVATTFVEASRARRDSSENLQVVPACEVVS